MTEFLMWIFLAAIMILMGFGSAMTDCNPMAWTCIGGSVICLVLAAFCIADLS